MSTLTDPSHDELRTLRARAYGPDADIHDDPVALARLQQLEAQERAAAAPVEPTLPPAQTADKVDAAAPAPPAALYPLDSYLAATGPAEGDTAPDAPASQADGIHPLEGSEDEVVVAARPWWRRRMRLLWVASLVAAVLLGVGLTLSVQSVTSGKVATLAVDEDGEWPTSNFGDRASGSVLFDEFHGLSVLGLPQGLGGDSSQVCLYVVSSVDSNGNGNLAAAGCGSGPYPATAAVTLTEASSKELRDAFPVGTALQFVLDGDQVHVYAKAPGFGQPTPSAYRPVLD